MTSLARDDINCIIEAEIDESALISRPLFEEGSKKRDLEREISGIDDVDTVHEDDGGLIVELGNMGVLSAASSIGSSSINECKYPSDNA